MQFNSGQSGKEKLQISRERLILERNGERFLSPLLYVSTYVHMKIVVDSVQLFGIYVQLLNRCFQNERDKNRPPRLVKRGTFDCSTSE